MIRFSPPRWSLAAALGRAVRQGMLLTVLIAGLLVTPALAGEGGNRSTEPSGPNQARGQGAAPADDHRYDDAVLLHGEGKTDAAIYLLQQVQKDYPNDTRVLFKLGEMAISAKNWAYAIEVLRRAADLRPDDVQARLVLMDVYHAYQMPIQEIKAGREIIAIDPKHADALARLAHLYEEQAMPVDEEQIRRTLAELAPRDYPNLKRLAGMLEKKGDLWEATLFYEKLVERFPDKAEDARALARLYGQDGDRYAEFHQWDKARSAPGGNMPEVAEAYRHAYYTHKRDLRMFDPFDGEVLVQQSVGPQDKVRDFDVKAGYNRLFITQNAELGISAHYRDQTYIPLTTAVAGNRGITSNGALLGYTHRWGGDRTVLRVRGGYETVSVSGNTVIVDPTVANATTFPFTEVRKFGGTTPVADVDLDHLFTRNFGIRAYAHFHVDEDVDAYVRLITRTGGGAELYYLWPDGTRISGLYQREGISDGNSSGYGTLHVDYPVYLSQPIRDRGGNRVGTLYPIPDHQVWLGYRFENLTYRKLSSFYESAPSDTRHTATLRTQNRIGEKFYFYGEGLLERGTVTQRSAGARAGFLYEDPDTRDRAIITYGTLSDFVKEGSQANLNLADGSRVQGVQLSVIWHFGTGPKVDTYAPRRHK